MKGNDASNVQRGRAWNRRKTAFIAFALLPALIVLSVLASIPLSQKPVTSNLATLASFTCSSSGDQTFIVNVDINLTDGMDQDEAIRVAAKVYATVHEHSSRPPMTTSLNASVLENGIWMVDFPVGYVTMGYCSRALNTWSYLSEKFYASINPRNLTVAYSIVRGR